MDLNKLRDEVHANAVVKGFWDKPLSDSHCLMLVITELSEAVEADRVDKRAQVNIFLNNANTSQKDPVHHWNFCFERFIKDTVEDELSDAFIRLLDLAGARSIDLSFATIDDLSDRDKKNFNYHSFTEKIFQLCERITKPHYPCRTEVVINDSIDFMSCIVQSMDIDLFWHVEQKMKYNQSRERMHGKKY